MVQRNLVYVVGLVLDICHDDLLRSAEYFGKFARPLKVCAQLWDTLLGIYGRKMHSGHIWHISRVARALPL